MIPGTVRVLARVLELDCPQAGKPPESRRLVVVAERQSSVTNGRPVATVRRPAAS